MARAYEDDLRRKFLTAYYQGNGSLEELAELFGVSLGWAKKISAQRKHSGQAERIVYQPGPRWRAGSEAQKRVVAWVEAQPDLTLVQLQAKLNNEAGVSISRGRVWYLVRKLGLRLKKSHSTPRSATQKPTASGVKSLSPRSARSRRNS